MVARNKNGGVSVPFKNGQRKLVLLDNNALADIKEACGVDAFALMRNAEDRMGEATKSLEDKAEIKAVRERVGTQELAAVMEPGFLRAFV